MTLSRILAAPHMREQEILRHDAPGVLCQIGEQAILDRGEGHFTPGNEHLVLSIVNGQISYRLWTCQGGSFIGRKLRTTQHSSYPCQQFIDTKGLGQIIIGSQVQATNLVLILTTCRHKNNRNSGKFAHTTTESKTIHLWHHHIEQDSIRSMSLNQFKGMLAIACRQHLVILKLKIARDQAQQLRVVISRYDRCFLCRHTAYSFCYVCTKCCLL